MSALITLLSAPGCWVNSDECDRGEVRCDGSIARVCGTSEESGAARWTSTNCGDRACIVSSDRNGARAFCALAPDRDPRCNEPDGDSCDGDALVECHSGYATSEHSCASGCIALDDQSDYCREAPPESARCVSGQGCQLAGPDFSATSSHAPGGECTPAELRAPDPSLRVYAYRCEDGLLTSRQRCALACLASAACTTSCAPPVAESP